MGLDPVVVVVDLRAPTVAELLVVVRLAAFGGQSRPPARRCLYGLSSNVLNAWRCHRFTSFTVRLVECTPVAVSVLRMVTVPPCEQFSRLEPDPLARCHPSETTASVGELRTAGDRKIQGRLRFAG